MEELVLMILRGLVIGVVISAPMGPVGIYCLQRTLDKGRLSGLYTGVGAAISDFIYCLLTGFGLSFIEDFINRHRSPIQLIGSVVLIFFGIWLIRKQPDGQMAADAAHGAPSREGDILKGFALTFSNPLILFLIIGLFAQFNFVIEGMKFYHYMLGFIGIIGGTLGWWWLVTHFVDKLRGHFTQRTMKLINMAIGVIILIFAGVGIFSSASSMMASRPVPLSAGGSLVSVDFRVADTSVKGWRAEFPCVDGGYVRLEVRPEAKYDPFGDSKVDVLMVRCLEEPSGQVLGEAVLSEGVDCFKGMNSWRVARLGEDWNVFAGNREYCHVMNFRTGLIPVGVPLLTANTPGAIRGSIVSAEVLEIDGLGKPVGEILTALDGCAPRAMDLPGLYSMLDYEHDDSYARLGGAYRVAVVPDDSGEGYAVYYLGGARENSGMWKPGMKKGRLMATPFANVYDVEWIDAEGELMLHDVQGEFDALAGTLTVKFPYLAASIRFRKE